MNRKIKLLFAMVILLCLGAVIFNINQKETITEDKTPIKSQNEISKNKVQTEELPDNETTVQSKPDNVKTEDDIDSIIDTDEKIAYLLKNMTLEEKVGQLMMVGFHGTEISSEITDLIQNKHFGGIIYFDRNMSSPEQVAGLSNSLQELATNNRFHLPLMMAIDQEGGSILRMRDKVSPIPSQQLLGKKAELEEVYGIAKINGTELNSMGIHINFAPVLDLSATDSRSFGTDPEKAFQYGKKTLEGLNDSSVTAALKHFPGNGRSEVDPHHDTSSVNVGQIDLENSDIYPFKQMIKEMDHQSFFVMVTHIKYPAYDQEKPASLSRNIIQDLLRDKLGYKGIVITDDLEMGAVNKYFSYKDMGKEAILAGADVLLVCHEYQHQLEVYNGIVEAVQKGEIPIERINESLSRILTYKLSQIETTTVDPKRAQIIVKNPEHINYINSLD